MPYSAGVAHVEFIGGPMDGHTRAVPLGSDEMPAPHITLEGFGQPEPGSRVLPVTVTVYQRRLHRNADGGLWEYVWVPPADHAERMRAALNE